MPGFTNPHIQDKSLEQLIDDLGLPVALPRSVVHEMMLAATSERVESRDILRRHELAGRLVLVDFDDFARL